MCIPLIYIFTYILFCSIYSICDEVIVLIFRHWSVSFKEARFVYYTCILFIEHIYFVLCVCLEGSSSISYSPVLILGIIYCIYFLVVYMNVFYMSHYFPQEGSPFYVLMSCFGGLFIIIYILWDTVFSLDLFIFCMPVSRKVSTLQYR